MSKQYVPITVALFCLWWCESFQPFSISISQTITSREKATRKVHSLRLIRPLDRKRGRGRIVVEQLSLRHDYNDGKSSVVTASTTNSDKDHASRSTKVRSKQRRQKQLYYIRKVHMDRHARDVAHHRTLTDRLIGKKTTDRLLGKTGSEETTVKDVLPVGVLRKHTISKAQLVMRFWKRQISSPGGSKYALVVEQLLFRLLAERDVGNPNVLIDTSTYNVALEAWSKSQSELAPRRAEDLLLQMEEAYAEGDTAVRPDRSSYNHVIKAWIRHGSKREAVLKAEQLLHRMTDGRRKGKSQRTEENDDGPVAAPVKGEAPSKRTYNLYLYSLLKSNLPDAAERAESILDQMLQEYVSGELEAKPDINTYTLVLRIMSRAPANDNELILSPAFRAQTILDALLTLNTKKFDVQPITHSFNAVMSAWLKYGQVSNNHGDDIDKSAIAVEKILTLLRQCEDQYSTGNTSCKPDSMMVTTVVAALVGHYKKVQGENTFPRDKRNQHEEIGNEDESADFTDTSRWLRKAVEFQDEMRHRYQVAADIVSNNILIDSWAKSELEEGPDLALQLLDQMEEDARLGFRNGTSEVLRPDSFTYTSVMDAFKRSGRRDAITQCEQILDRMKAMMKEEATLLQTEESERHSVCVYNSLLNAYASKVGQAYFGPGGAQAEAALSLLQEMESGKSPHIPEPDRITYNTVLKALRQSTSNLGKTKSKGKFCTHCNHYAKQAELLLERMEEISRVTPHSQMAPDTFSYGTVLTTLARSQLRDKAVRAHRILLHMLGKQDSRCTTIADCLSEQQEEHSLHSNIGSNKDDPSNEKASTDALVIKPNIFCVNAALNACAFISLDGHPKEAPTNEDERQQRQSIMDIVTDIVFSLAPKYSLPLDDLSYATALRACSVLFEVTDPCRDELANAFFDEAKRAGQVSNKVLEQFRFASPSTEQAKLGSTQGNCGDDGIPEEWCRNVVSAVVSNTARSDNWKRKKANLYSRNE